MNTLRKFEDAIRRNYAIASLVAYELHLRRQLVTVYGNREAVLKAEAIAMQFGGTVERNDDGHEIIVRFK